MTASTTTICPVCGSAIDAELPPLHIGLGGRARPLRVCSTACAELAALAPNRYAQAAAAGTTAETVDDRPLPFED